MQKDRVTPKIVEYEFNASTDLITTTRHSDNVYAMPAHWNGYD